MTKDTTPTKKDSAEAPLVFFPEHGVSARGYTIEEAANAAGISLAAELTEAGDGE